MSAQQRKVCAGKLPPESAALFLSLLDEADSLFRASVEARREAWAVYRVHVPNTAPRKGGSQ
jgi:hypothetical protein